MKNQLGERDERPERWNAHTVIEQVDSLKNGELALIFDCGYEDFFYQVNLNLHDKLLKLGVGHDFQVRPRAHNAAYWSVSLPPRNWSSSSAISARTTLSRPPRAASRRQARCRVRPAT